MNEKVKLYAASVWTALIGAISPHSIGLIFMSITGNGKGYDYDLGAEKDISVLFGVVHLILWLLAVVPSMIFLCRKFYAEKKVYAIIPVAVFVICFLFGILMMGNLVWSNGFAEFVEYFGG